MNLTATTHTLELVTSTANSTTWAVSWVDIDKSGASTVATPGSAQGTISSATTTTIVSAPAGSIYRTITGITILASDTQTLTVQKDVSATNYSVARGVLSANEALCYEDGAGWYTQNANGERKGIGATGAAGTNGGGTVLGSGTSIVDFGSSGSNHTTLTVTGQASIIAASLVFCWVKPEATVDHSADEHIAENIIVYASDIVAATGFTIHAKTGVEIISDTSYTRLGRFTGTGQDAGRGQAARNNLLGPGGKTPLLKGKWSVGWIYTQ